MSHILCPHLKASPSQARGFIVHDPQISRQCPSTSCSIYMVFIFSYTKTNTQRGIIDVSRPHLLNHRGRSPPRPPSSMAGIWKVIPSSFLCHCRWRAGWLAPMQRGGARAGSGADELQARCGAANRQGASASGPSHAIAVRLCDGGNWRDRPDNLI